MTAAFALFLSFVEKQPTGCWLWTGGKISAGYGSFASKRLGVKQILAHRWSYEYHNSAIPEGLVIDHLCDTRLCVNPAHLRACTHRENILRGTSLSAQRARRTRCIHGHEFTPENTRMSATRGRVCRTCKRRKDKKDYAKNLEHSRARARIRTKRYREKQCRAT